MANIFVQGGPFVIARRANAQDKWQVFDRGFATEAEARAFIAKQDPNFEYSWANIKDMRPVAVSRTTDTKH
jgi:hypothetical protein